MTVLYDQDRDHGLPSEPGSAREPGDGQFGRPTAAAADSAKPSEIWARRLVALGVLVLMLLAFGVLLFDGSGWRPDGSAALAVVGIVAIASLPLGLGIAELCLPVRDRRRRDVTRVMATVVRVEREGRLGQQGYQEWPVLRLGSRDGVREVRAASAHGGLLAGEQVAAWEDPADPVWTDLAVPDRRALAGHLAFVGIGAVFLMMIPEAITGGDDAAGATTRSAVENGLHIAWIALALVSVAAMVYSDTATGREARRLREVWPRTIEASATVTGFAVGRRVAFSTEPAKGVLGQVPLVTFHTREGAPHTARLDVSASPKTKLSRGATLRIRYDPLDLGSVFDAAAEPKSSWWSRLRRR